MAADISPHLQEPASLDGLHLQHVKGVNVFPNVPGVATVGRTFCDNAFDEACCAAGAAGAAPWIARFRPVYEDNRHVTWWQGPNEFILSTAVRANAWAAFHVAFATQMDALGFKACSGGINTGWPRLRYYGDPPPYVELLGPAFEALRAYGGICSFHEYWGAAGPLAAGGNFGRIQHTVQEAADHGVALPPVFMGEIGLDQHVVDGGAHRGWLDMGLTPTQYGDQLQTAMDCYRALGYVLGASVFTVCSWDWLGFNARPVFGRMGEINMQEPTITRARGIDVSEYQGEVNWAAVAADGVRFAFLRASSGKYADPTFARNWQGAGAAGVLRGAYHYLQPDVGGQAGFFVNAVAGRELELGYWADVEAAGLTADKVQSHLTGLDTKLADAGIEGAANVYTRANFWNSLGVPASAVAGRFLWVAYWTYDPTGEPAIPQAWDTWEWWQYSNQGQVAGVPARVDLDVFHGDDAALAAKYGPVPPPVPLRYFWFDGAEADEAAFRARFGDFQVQRPPCPNYCVAELRARGGGSCELAARVLDGQGAPVANASVRFAWPGGSLTVQTSAEGWATLGMGAQSCYTLPGRGPYQVMLVSDASELLDGGGWICFTQYERFDIVFRPCAAPATYALAVQVLGQGTVALDPPGGAYPPGFFVVLEANPAEGWRFAGWSGDLAGGDNPAVLVMDRDKAVLATFVEEGGGVDLAIELIEQAQALLAEAIAILEDL